MLVLSKNPVLFLASANTVSLESRVASVSSPVFVPDKLEADIVQGVTRFPESYSVAEEFCISFPVVLSYRAIALSVDEAGHTTSQSAPL